MNERVQELWSQYLSGAELSPEDERELLSAMQADPKLRERLLADERLDGAMRAFGRGKEDAEAFTQSVADSLAAEGTGRKFISGVRRKVQAEVAQRDAAPARSVRIVRLPQKSGTQWLPYSIAALVALIVLAMLLKSPPPVDTAQNPPPPKPPDQPAPPVENVFAKVIKSQGEVIALSGGKRNLAPQGHVIVSGDGLETGIGSTATLELLDGTHIDAKAKSNIQQLSETTTGKSILIASGLVKLDVAKQPEGKPMLVKTANAELQVIGTKFEVETALGSTRLDVEEGKVRLTRLADRSSVDVATGQFVVAEAGTELAVKARGVARKYLHVDKNGNVESLAFSPDGRWLAAGYIDGRARIWDMQSDAPPRVIDAHRGERVRSIQFSHDGNLIATGAWDRTAKIWDLNGVNQHTVTCTANVWAVVFSPDDKSIATGDFKKNLRFWSTANGSELPTVDPQVNEVLSLAYSFDGKTLAVAGTRGVVKLLDSSTLKDKATAIKTNVPIDSVTFSPDDHLVATANGEAIGIWDATNARSKNTLSGHKGTVRCVRFTMDGKTLISGSEDTTVKLWDVATGNEINTLTKHRDKVAAIAVSAKGDIFASGAADIFIWPVDEVRK